MENRAKEEERKDRLVNNLKRPKEISPSVQRLRNALHISAKESPDRRFHALMDKVYRMNFLLEAWRWVRMNKGAPGVDSKSIEEIESEDVVKWLRELSQELREGGYKPQAFRSVRIPKKQPGQFRELGIPTVRDRVVQTAALFGL